MSYQNGDGVEETAWWTQRLSCGEVESESSTTGCVLLISFLHLGYETATPAHLRLSLIWEALYSETAVLSNSLPKGLYIWLHT